MSNVLRNIAYLPAAALAWCVYGFFALLPLDIASALGGLIGRTVGPLTKRHAIARDNITQSFPEFTDAQVNETLRRMWDNIGRVYAEYPHLHAPKMLARLNVHGMEHIEANKSKALCYIAAHYGNWELAPVTAWKYGTPLMLMYRKPNNPFVDMLIRRIRLRYCNGLYHKGGDAARAMVRAMNKKEPLGLLFDQKTNEGVAVPLFGREAMTSTAVSQMALKYDVVVLAARVKRTHGTHFEVFVSAPLSFTKTGDNEADTTAIALQINQMLEGWVRDDPAQWYWVHRRWPK